MQIKQKLLFVKEQILLLINEHKNRYQTYQLKLDKNQNPTKITKR